MRDKKVRRRFSVSSFRREGVGVMFCSTSVGVRECRVPKERYWPVGGGGGMRLRSSGGRKRRSGKAPEAGRLSGNLGAEGSRCSLRRSRFWGVKDL